MERDTCFQLAERAAKAGVWTLAECQSPLRILTMQIESVRMVEHP
jgi:hypothetical protein